MDKLCSNKMPINAQILLRETKTNSVNQHHHRQQQQRTLTKEMQEIEVGSTSSSNQTLIDRQQSFREEYKDNKDNKLSSRDGEKIIITSTPETEPEPFLNDDLKARLERILASPVKQPEHYSIRSTNKITKDVLIHSQHHHHHGQGDAGMDHQDEINNIIKPVPLPRKRVMFEQPNNDDDRFHFYKRDHQRNEDYLGNQSL